MKLPHFIASELDKDVNSCSENKDDKIGSVEKVKGQLLVQEHVEGDIPIEVASNKRDLPNDASSYFKLGMDNVFHSYKNQYSSNPNAKSKTELLIEKDRRRYLISKFQLNNFTWVGNSFKRKNNFALTFQNTLLTLENVLPAAFLHPIWYKIRLNWIEAVKLCNLVTDFVSVLLYFEKMIKPVLMVNVWNESCGSLKFTRIQGEVKSSKGNKLKPRIEKEKIIDVIADDSAASDEETDKFTGTYVHFFGYQLYKILTVND